jgi:hypothetical protein
MGLGEKREYIKTHTRGEGRTSQGRAAENFEAVTQRSLIDPWPLKTKNPVVLTGLR